ncbi:SMP-30/gluconolactonase/LRE family protein [Rathayibacter sp. VKM Ac-2803]|uniref:SMP-30/gluconolactonase/LRE family protein n=1 Tax=unclassified Rathayibacter TaxID=2609250 RepID=UPI00135B9BEF|nr:MULTISPECIES: SMP-30/gluconolactonase/LRE family protein [unclassified Rathayibacter]MWV48707.1 SMP-30/gluconolactonase/LRE family protein [Rathayibacter sp. VKM Ac-2803]MWV60313.1 SMP-30/gluconolactonase/LRE family protein [Rathayibacter sp. VKM Ac-2754]
MRNARLLAVPAVLALAGCTAAAPDDAAPDGSAATGGEITAERVLQVSEVHEATGMTLLEGPVFGPDGSLYVVDVVAPPGAGKVLRVDLEDDSVETVHTDDAAVLTSAQFGPADGRLYVTDFVGGAIRSMTTDGTDVREVFSGPVDGVPMQPDDIAFGPDGALYVTDAAGATAPYWEASGRVVRIDPATAEATVLASDLPSPNGVGFSPDYDALWVSLNTGNRIDRLTLSPEGTEVATAHPAIVASAGIGQVDSIAVDADGRLYVGLHNRPEILVYDTEGALLTTVTVPEGEATGLASATNVAIEPGGTDAYATISGADGGFVYRFEALGEGIPQSNGG